MLRRIVIVALCFVVCVCFSMPAFGSSKKTVYVCTKAVHNDMTEDDSDAVLQIKYKKNGLLKSANMSSPGDLMNVKWDYNYKSGRIKNGRYRMYFLQKKVDSGKGKFFYDKEGRLVKAVTYQGKKKKRIFKVNYDTNGNVSSETTCSGNGKPLKSDHYIRDNNGKTIKVKHYSKGSLQSTTEYVWTDKRTLETTTYDADGNLQSKERSKYSHDDLVSSEEYDANGDKTGENKKYYKKIVTQKASAVNKQQHTLSNYLILND